MAKRIFIAFAVEDVTQRDFLKGQSLNTNSPFEYIDLSVKERYESGWKDKVRTRIKGSDGVIALVSTNTLKAEGEIWEIDCAIEEDIPLTGLWAYKTDRTRPAALSGHPIIEWNWDKITAFIDGV